jgi:hypothetical protein
MPRAVLWAGLACGILDIGSAFVDAHLSFGLTPVRLLQNVAGALLGPASASYGLGSAALGLAMHFSVAFSWTTIFYLLSRRFPVLLRYPVISGPVYGAVIFLVMYRGVIPLTIELKSFYLTVPFNHTWPKLRWSQFGVHLICVGLTMALTMRRFSPPTGKS